MHILGLVWSRKMDLSSVNWMHAEGTMSRQTYQPLVCTCFPHPSLCLQSYVKNAERCEPQNTVENTAESQFSWNIAYVLSGTVSGAGTYWKQATVAATLVRVPTSSHGNVIVSFKIYSPSCKGGAASNESSPTAWTRHLRVHFADEGNCEQPGKPHSEIWLKVI